MLNTFNSIVLQIAIILLIITLAFIGYVINKSIRGSTVQFPPVTGICPDYWSAEDISGATMCINNIRIGNVNNPDCDKFDTNTMSTTCDKYSFAKMCSISWDGITNNQDNRTICT